jgi:hypothetical protein
MQSSYIYFRKGSKHERMTLDEVKEEFKQYIHMSEETGVQLGFEYAEVAFPYTIEPIEGEGDNQFFTLKTTDAAKYSKILVGVGTHEEADGTPAPFIQLTLTDTALAGDKYKGLEFAKYIAKRNLAEVKMFNGRTIYYNPRK